MVYRNISKLMNDPTGCRPKMNEILMSSPSDIPASNDLISRFLRYSHWNVSYAYIY